MAGSYHLPFQQAGGPHQQHHHEDDEGDYYSIDVKSISGTSIHDVESFAEYLPNRDNWVENQVSGTLIASGIGTAKLGGDKLIHKIVSKSAAKANARSNAFASAAIFAVDLGFHIYDMSRLIDFRETVHNKADENSTFDITSFGISSPVFAGKGGATRCPYEGEEETSFYVDNAGEAVNLNVATLQREVPVIDVFPSILRDVPEDEQATFTLQLQNESASETGMWYNLLIDESTNPDGAILLIDGTDPEKEFLVPYGETIETTLTITKGQADVFEYDSIGLV